jgi:shikimate dehydrogenase
LITGKTAICGLIGDPVEHSVSPGMQNAAFQSLGLNCAYVPFRVERESLADAIKGMRALNIRGLNVTIPHKVAVIPLLDKIDRLSAAIGAVNTIVNDGGILSGYNTDASGFMQSLKEQSIEVAGKRVLILGAGGSARAVAFALAEMKAIPIIMNRSIDKAIVIAQLLKDRSGKAIEVFELNITNLTRTIKNSEMVVNTTSIGMHPNSTDTPVPGYLLRKDLLVYDIVYNPLQTRLCREATIAGATVIGGIDMLAWQGAEAFEKWTGREAPVEVMKREIVRQLNQYEK